MYTEEEHGKSSTITVNVKATAEITIDTMQVTVYPREKKTVEALVNEVVKIQNPTSLAKVTRRSDNAEIFLTEKLSDFGDDTVLDISK